MSSQLGLVESTVIINGITITGFSSDADALSIPEIEVAAPVFGADGRMLVISTGNRGGLVTIKLLASSSSIAFLTPLSALAQAGSGVVIQGLVRSNTQLSSVALQNGYFTKYVPYPTMGKGAVSAVTYEMAFEVIAPDYSSANLN